MDRHAWTAAAIGALLLASACTMDETSAPDPTGPSEFGLSIGLAANPDVLTMDGHATADIVITARNSMGDPAGGVGIRADVLFQGQVRDDMGHLSSKSTRTGSDGRALLTYTAPQSASGISADSGNDVIQVRVTPVGTDAAAAVGRTVSIRLVPQGIILPPAGTPVARFRFEPESPKEGEAAAFDGSLSRDCAPNQTVVACLAQAGPSPSIVSYHWDWGDGDDADGIQQYHAYQAAGTYLVTLTVTNERGLKGSESKFITVGAGPQTKADFFFSPTDPLPGQTVFFDGGISSAPPGIGIVSWQWNFGDGATGSGPQVSHTYPNEGTYTVQLTVTDSRGQTARTTKSVPVKTPPPPGD